MMPPYATPHSSRLTALSALSLLFCVAVCMLWARSYFTADQWTHAVRPPDDVEFARAYAKRGDEAAAAEGPRATS